MNKPESGPKPISRTLFIGDLERPAKAQQVTTLAIGEECFDWGWVTTEAVGEECIKKGK
jgi:hypothetical protein